MKNNSLPGRGIAAEHGKKNATVGADQRAPGTSEAARAMGRSSVPAPAGPALGTPLSSWVPFQ